MSKISFVKTIVPTGQYMDREKMGDRYIIHFDPVEDKAMDAYVCVECSVPISEYNGSEVLDAYEAWKEKTEGRALAHAIRAKVAEIEAYDTSDKVNGFYLNGNLVAWDSEDNATLNKNTRMGLRQNIKDKLSLGEEDIDMWLGGIKITLPCEKADSFMCSLENYAYECFNVTAAHKKAVEDMKSVEEIESFDVTADYPSQLKMEV